MLDITNLSGKSQIIPKTWDTTKEIKSINFFRQSFLFLSTNLMKRRCKIRIKYQRSFTEKD